MNQEIDQPHNTQCSIINDYLDYIPQKLIEQPENSLDQLNIFIAATEACTWFPADLPMGGSAIASSNQPIPCPNGNSNNITYIIRVENM